MKSDNAAKGDFSLKELKSAPNAISLSRILMLPIFMLLIFIGNVYSDISAMLLVVAAGVSDFLDGYVARRTGKVSDLGKILDPLADKLFFTSAFVVLSVAGRFPFWASGIIVIREIAVTIMRANLLKSGIILMASEWGKLKTNIQILALCFFSLHFSINGAISPFFHEEVLVYLTVFSTLASGVDYLRCYIIK